MPKKEHNTILVQYDWNIATRNTAEFISTAAGVYFYCILGKELLTQRTLHKHWLLSPSDVVPRGGTIDTVIVTYDSCITVITTVTQISTTVLFWRHLHGVCEGALFGAISCCKHHQQSGT